MNSPASLNIVQRHFVLTFFQILIFVPLFTFAQTNNFSANNGFSQPNHDLSSRPEKSGIEYKLNKAVIDTEQICFSNEYSLGKGIFTFRGGPFRNKCSMGVLEQRPGKISTFWTFKTAVDTTKAYSKTGWGGGAGWTGQPCIIEWPVKQRLAFQSLYKPYIEKENFSEIILGSLCGKVYFLDLETGKPTRDAIETGGPIKGSISINPGGFPYLCVGQGIPKNDKIGFRIYNLNSNKLLHFQSGLDSFAFRNWGAFDSSPLFDVHNNKLWWPGENGLIYRITLDTLPDFKSSDIIKFRFKTKYSKRKGTESCLASYKNFGYFTDNDGNVVCLDLQTFRPVWTFYNNDDTDASPVIEEEDGHPFLYVGCEVDFQGDQGISYFRKLDGLTGELKWEKQFPCQSITTGDNIVNGGILATPAIGKQKGKDYIIVSVARYGSLQGGSLFWINKQTGEIAYTFKMKNYAWSSPVDIYDKNGNMYVFTADSGGNVYLLDGLTGTEIDRKNVGVTFEASPVAWDDKIVLAGRGNVVFCFKLK